MTLAVESGSSPGSYRLVGELDLSTVPLAERGLAPSRSAEGITVLDLSQLTFMDSSGVRLILELLADHRAQGRDLILIDPTGPVRRLFDILELEANGVRVDVTASEEA
jgi:anti-anti-sigma factor